MERNYRATLPRQRGSALCALEELAAELAHNIPLVISNTAVGIKKSRLVARPLAPSRPSSGKSKS